MPTNLDNMLAPRAQAMAKARADVERLARHRRTILAKLEEAGVGSLDFTPDLLGCEGKSYRIRAHHRDRHVSITEGPFPDGSEIGLSDADALAMFDWLLTE